MKLLIRWYVDDLLNVFHVYCTEWKLKVNVAKTRSGSSLKARKHVTKVKSNPWGTWCGDQKIWQITLVVKCQLDLSHKMVVPVLSYGCEYRVLKTLILLKVFIYFFKNYFIILKVKLHGTSLW